MDDLFGLTQITIDEMLKRWPATVKVVHQLRLVCVGCGAAPFCTVAEAAKLHGLEVSMLLEQLATIIQEEENQ
ncbi:MAG: DUF1858 domain-containing protein [Ardenticatenaceae bacterium]|nr:DUF1858 domain-containing protein [Ardenticatenaceae bacterium]